ncbi:thiamine diphosphokinase, partial [Faecalibaculum rodentium]
MTRPLILVTPATTVIPDVHGADYAAVDAGLLTLTEQGINPVFACGDFDSLKTPLDPCDVPEGCRLLRFPAEKNESDSQLAVQEAIHLGYDPVILTGSLSGRIDHTLANIRLLTHHHP